MNKLLISGLALAGLAVSSFAQESAKKIEFGGNVYSQYRWTDASNAYDGTPFGGLGAYTDPTKGRADNRFGNYMRTEVGLELKANISEHVKGYMYAKTIFDADDPTDNTFDGVGDGEDANAAAWQTFFDSKTGWFKLRGFQIDIMPKNMIDKVTMGTPYGLPFNQWIVADRRYIDRFNTKGILAQGHFTETFKWNIARLWMPQWQTRKWGNLNDMQPEDGNWAVNLNSPIGSKAYLGIDGSIYTDHELTERDGYNLDENMNGRVSTEVDFMNWNYGLNLRVDATDEISLGINAIGSGQNTDSRWDMNEDNILDTDDWGSPAAPYADINFSGAGTFSLLTTDPFGVGFSPTLEVFYIDDNYTAMNGSRREHDLLMMDGGINGFNSTSLRTFFYGGGQSAVRHVDNDYLRLGEDIYESVVGYGGVTLDLNHITNMLSFDVQGNYFWATNNTGGDTDKDDKEYTGDGDFYMAPKDYSAIVASAEVGAKLSKVKTALDFKYGLWQDDVAKDDKSDDLSRQAIKVGLMFGLPLGKSFTFELNPAYHNLVNEVGSDDTTDNRLLLGYKLTYSMGGFDMWVEAQHTALSGDSYDKDFGEVGANVVHAAAEIKF